MWLTHDLSFKKLAVIAVNFLFGGKSGKSGKVVGGKTLFSKNRFNAADQLQRGACTKKS